MRDHLFCGGRPPTYLMELGNVTMSSASVSFFLFSLFLVKIKCTSGVIYNVLLTNSTHYQAVILHSPLGHSTKTHEQDVNKAEASRISQGLLVLKGNRIMNKIRLFLIRKENTLSRATLVCHGAAWYVA